MIAAMRRAATLLALLLASPAAAQQAVVDESIGTWRLTCATDRMTDRRACRMLHARPVERSEPGRPALALEVVERDGRLVPAVTARDLTLEGAARGLLALSGTAQLRFPPNPLFEMPCDLEGRSLVCAPRPEDLARAEAELPAADRVPSAQCAPGDVQAPLADALGRWLRDRRGPIRLALRARLDGSALEAQLDEPDDPASNAERVRIALGASNSDGGVA
jgi:hypothetical protein